MSFPVGCLRRSDCPTLFLIDLLRRFLFCLYTLVLFDSYFWSLSNARFDFWFDELGDELEDGLEVTPLTVLD